MFYVSSIFYLDLKLYQKVKIKDLNNFDRIYSQNNLTNSDKRK